MVNPRDTFHRLIWIETAVIFKKDFNTDASGIQAGSLQELASFPFSREYMHKDMGVTFHLLESLP